MSIKSGKRTYKQAHCNSHNRHHDSISKKRLRKDQDTQKLLKKEFIMGEPWSKEKICELSDKIGLKQSQIYKWNWDMIRKHTANVAVPGKSGRAACDGEQPPCSDELREGADCLNSKMQFYLNEASVSGDNNRPEHGWIHSNSVSESAAC